MIGSFDDYTKMLQSDPKDFTNNGKCSNCGQCCSSLLHLSKKETERIRRYCIKKGIRPIKHDIPVNNTVIDLKCPFLDETKELKCMIYQVRPYICRIFKCNIPAYKANFTMKELSVKREPVYMHERFKDLFD